MRLRALLCLVVALTFGMPAIAEDPGCVAVIAPFYLCDGSGKCIQIGWTVEYQCSSGRGATGSW